MTDATKPIPPLITLVKPIPINPLQIWRETYSEELAANLLEAETKAMEQITESERNEALLFDARNETIELLSSDDESVFGEMIERVTQRNKTSAVGKRKKRSQQQQEEKAILSSLLMQLRILNLQFVICWTARLKTELWLFQI